MKVPVYILLYHDDTDQYPPTAESKAYPSMGEAMSVVRSEFKDTLERYGYKEGFRDDDDYAEINESSASICDGKRCNYFYWEVDKQFVDLPLPAESEAAHA